MSATPQQLVEQALAASTTDGCVVLVQESSSANLRFAANTLTTNGVSRSRSITVIAVDGAKAATVTRSRVPDGGVAELVAAAEAAARDAEPAEDAEPLVQAAASQGDWAAPPAETTIGHLAGVADGLGAAFDGAGGDESPDVGLYGYVESTLDSIFVGSSTGLRSRFDSPVGRFELTGRSPDGSRSAWTGQSTRTFADVDVAAHAAEVTRRLEWAKRRIELPAGRYETLLPPSAVGDLMVYLYWSAAALDASQGRTVFSKPGGGTRVGEQLARLPLTLASDPALPGQQAVPFVVAPASSRMSSVFDNGLPLARTEWIVDGELRALIAPRFAARETGLPVAPPIANLLLDGGGDACPDTAELVAATGRGLLLTCLWYIRVVDPQTLLLTGLTRDGVFLVEDGEVVGAVNNFRFNESPVDLLGRAVEAGCPVATLPREFGDYFPSCVMPPLRIPDFHMSSVSQAS